jgi:hypothetical protein
MEDSAHGSNLAPVMFSKPKVSINERAADGAPLEVPLAPEDPLWSQIEPITAIDPRDLATPDSWIPRNPVCPHKSFLQSILKPPFSNPALL